MQCTLYLQNENNLHVAIIMDGNGRWASARLLPRSAGHVAGIRALRRTIDAAPALGIGILTVYAFSVDNWRRPAEEVDALMELMRSYLDRDVQNLVGCGIRLQVIGRRDRLPSDLAEAIASAERATIFGDRLLVRVALDYSSRDAILDAAAQFKAAPTREVMSRVLAGDCRAGDVDLLIRTSGEKRLSDFMLWEAAYAELHFTDRLWPDFDACDLAAALHEFQTRERRYGGIAPPSRHEETAAPIKANEAQDAEAAAT
ncbi:MAG: di-trans,poly-cis-decaprenylcistransferase [Hyphomicrobiaceae bacterium]